MSYMALYRKARPSTFDEVRGQDHIVTTLRNQIKQNRLSHAYLFSGTRGTGKTSVAKILAKAVNCESPIDGSPCGVCDLCQAIQKEQSLNVIEIDAASNNGVDHIRVIREEVNYRPTSGKYKVYIIDEVHMLSISAFNALLKTLEEPPEYVIFILATTESFKIPITIKSRCLQFDFRRISIDTISSYMKVLLEQEQVQAEEEAVVYIAKVADGSMRDALSLLDQCIAFYMNQKLTYDKVLELLGAVDIEVFSKMLGYLHSANVTKLMQLLEDILMDGRDIIQVIQDFTFYLRNLMLIHTSGGESSIIDASSEHRKLYMQDAKTVTKEEIFRYIRIFSEASNQLRYSTMKRVLFETTMIKAAIPSMEIDSESVLERIRKLEELVDRTDTNVFSQSNESDTTARSDHTLGYSEKKEAEKSVNQENKLNIELSEEEKKARVSALPDDVRETIRLFRTITKTLPEVSKGFLLDGKVAVGENNELMLLLENDLAFLHMIKPENLKQLEDAIYKRIGKEVRVRILRERTQKNQKPFDIEAYIKDKIKIDIIEEE